MNARGLAGTIRGSGKEVSMPNPVLAEIIGPDILIVLVVILVLFGGSQLPKLARGLGSAQREFKKGLEEGAADDKDASKPDSKSD
jgi:sec-independent protein translocase protein TatA